MLITSLFFSIYSYVIIFLFFALFIYTINFYNSLTNSINFSLLYTTTYNKFNFILFLGSLVGIPPLFGFFSKTIMFINLLLAQKFYYFIILLVLNLILMVFYLQQIRFLQTNFKKTNFLFYKHNINFTITYLILFFQMINLFSFFFTPFLFKLFVLSVLI